MGLKDKRKQAEEFFCIYITYRIFCIRVSSDAGIAIYIYILIDIRHEQRGLFNTAGQSAVNMCKEQ